MMTPKDAFIAYYHTHLQEIEKAKFYLDFHMNEFVNHKTMGIQQAEEAVGIWQGRLKTLETHLKLLDDYKLRKYP